jgi:hypothetical protein
MKLKKLYEILGGLNEHTETITISGGFTINNIHVENSIVIGDATSNFIKNKIIEWDTFKSTYYKDNKLDPKFYTKFLNVLNNIYILPNFTTDENEILYMINNIYNAKPAEIINGLTKIINIYQPLKLAIKHLFMIYKVYIEQLIETYVNLRDSYIIKLKDATQNNFKEMTARWNIIDTENKIDTSSPILFFNFPPSKINLEKSIPKIEWQINSKEGNHKKINLLVDKFLKEIKTRNFEYVGYCPMVASHRFQLLLKFPVDHLIRMIDALREHNHKNTNNSTAKKHCDFNSNIVKKINALTKKIKDINESIPAIINIKYIKVANIQKFPNDMTIPQKVNCFEQYIKAFLQLYKDLIPYIIKKEKSINTLAININMVSSDIANYQF